MSGKRDLTAEMLAHYESGATLTEIGVWYGMSSQAVHQRLQKAGYVPRRQQQVLCAVKDCEETVSAERRRDSHLSGLCQYHYNRRWRGVADWPKPTGRTSGTAYSYRQGCRCERCSEANADYRRGLRTTRMSQRVMVNGRWVHPQAPHGTPTAVQTYGCRCDVCRTEERQRREANPLRCSVRGCARPHVARGYCKRHYAKRVQRTSA